MYFPAHKEGEKPDPAPVHWLTDDENFSDAPELDTLGKVLIRMYSIWVRFSLG